MKYFKHNFNVKIICCQYDKLPYPWRNDNTVDPFMRFYYVHKGQGRIVCGKQNIAMEKGKLYLLPSQTPLTFWTSGYINLYWLHVQLTLAPGIDFFSLAPGKVMCIPALDDSLVEKLKLLSQEDVETVADDLRSQALITEIIAIVFQRYNIELPEQFEKDLKRFEAVIQLIENSPRRKWRIPELARQVGLGQVQFSKEFKRVFGIPPAKFIMSKRLEHARYMLLNSNRTLEDIADSLGFSDAFHFSKSFKAGIGLSPKEFRIRRSLNQP